MTEQEEQIAAHECGHAAMAHVLGMNVIKVSRRSADPRRYLGYTRIPFDDLLDDIDKEKARKCALMLIAGPGMADQPLPTWPLSENKTNDERLLKCFVDYIGMTETNYLGLQAEMWTLSATERFERFFNTLMCWFEYVDEIDEGILAWSKARVLAWPELEAA